jgi:hypothetical protein
MTGRDGRDDTTRNGRGTVLLIVFVALIGLLVAGGTTGSVLSDDEEANATFSVGTVSVSNNTITAGNGTATPEPTVTTPRSQLDSRHAS